MRKYDKRFFCVFYV